MNREQYIQKLKEDIQKLISEKNLVENMTEEQYMEAYNIEEEFFGETEETENEIIG